MWTAVRFPARTRTKSLVLVGVLAGVLLADQATKGWVVRTHEPRESVALVGQVVEMTYTHNPGALLGVHVGEHSRAFFLTLKAATLVLLGLLYRATPAREPLRLAAVALVAAGALGNALDRVRYPEGVVDLLIVRLAGRPLPTFNLADVAVVAGATLLLASLLREYLREEP